MSKAVAENDTLARFTSLQKEKGASKRSLVIFSPRTSHIFCEGRRTPQLGENIIMLNFGDGDRKARAVEGRRSNEGRNLI